MTSIGKMQAYALGKKLRERYSQLLDPHFLPKEVSYHHVIRIRIFYEYQWKWIRMNKNVVENIDFGLCKASDKVGTAYENLEDKI